MTQKLKLMCILAHPDDESLGTGGILAKYSAEGVITYLVTATRGERGWFGSPDEYPGPQPLGKIREAELQAAAQILGVKETTLLDYHDGALDQADPQQVITDLVFHIRRIRPHVIVTFDPNGYYGHPDHIAISQFAASAVLAAADPGFERLSSMRTHRISKLYYFIPLAQSLQVYQAAFGDLVMSIDGVERRAVGWTDWSVTTQIDTSEYWQQVWRAVACHKTQLPGYQALQDLPDESHRKLWGTQTLYRVLSLVNGGRAVEDDLFAGLRVNESEDTTHEVPFYQ
jgi:LmbE family N-acetylglucosaminyl deacetylase